MTALIVLIYFLAPLPIYIFGNPFWGAILTTLQVVSFKFDNKKKHDDCSASPNSK